MSRWLILMLLAVLAMPARSSRAATGGAEKPRLAFLELANGPGVEKALAGTAGDLLVVALSETGKFEVITRTDIKAILGLEAQSQLVGCAESSCMVDLGGALGAAYLVNGSLGKLGSQYQLVLSLIDVNKAKVGKRVAQSVKSDEALPQAIREAVMKLTGELVPESGPVDACAGPPCAKEAIETCRRWFAREWDALSIVGVVPDGPYEQRLIEHKPSRIFPLIIRARTRDGSREEYAAYIRYERVEGDWFFAEGSLRHLRSLPIFPDDPPPDAERQKILMDGFSAAHNKATVTKLVEARFPDYSRPKDSEPATWEYQFDVTYKENGVTKTCARASAKLMKTPQRTWRYQPGSDGGSCTDVLDAK